MGKPCLMVEDRRSNRVLCSNLLANQELAIIESRRRNSWFRHLSLGCCSETKIRLLASTCSLWKRKTPLMMQHTPGVSGNFALIVCCLPYFCLLSCCRCHPASPVPRAGRAAFERYVHKTCKVCYTNEASLNWKGEGRPVLM